MEAPSVDVLATAEQYLRSKLPEGKYWRKLFLYFFWFFLVPFWIFILFSGNEGSLDMSQSVFVFFQYSFLFSAYLCPSQNLSCSLHARVLIIHFMSPFPLAPSCQLCWDCSLPCNFYCWLCIFLYKRILIFFNVLLSYSTELVSASLTPLLHWFFKMHFPPLVNLILSPIFYLPSLTLWPTFFHKIHSPHLVKLIVSPIFYHPSLTP